MFFMRPKALYRRGPKYTTDSSAREEESALDHMSTHSRPAQPVTYRTPRLRPQMLTILSLRFIFNSQIMKQGTVPRAKSMQTA